MSDEKTVITLICERAADVHDILNKEGQCTTVPGLKAITLPCSGMIQPLMIEAAMKAGASGVIVCGCQIGDCYYREGNKMIRERLLGERPPGLKKTVDRRRVMALWLSRLQKGRFETEAKEFVAYCSQLDGDVKVAAKIEGAKATPAAAPAASGAKIDTAPAAVPAAKIDSKDEKPKPREEAMTTPEAKFEPKETAKGEAKATGTDSGAQNAEGAAVKAEESAEKKADAKKAAADDATPQAKD
ncbi:MAG: hydrogenase iron-sulfur subunit [Candidatus Melainabacteria bacterium]|nr:hydrogenase iron-sulfur subunit [Candidatus Melainabacteria bacterium]